MVLLINNSALNSVKNNIMTMNEKYFVLDLTFGSHILATPPSFLMSAGTLSSAMTAQAYTTQQQYFQKQQSVWIQY